MLYSAVRLQLYYTRGPMFYLSNPIITFAAKCNVNQSEGAISNNVLTHLDLVGVQKIGQQFQTLGRSQTLNLNVLPLKL